ncbi:MAG: sigma-70 family RNA polymerase sigma factor [Candidatus Hydrogenedentes bacterium]|nr:sigma-70 family RNA polymerase sigma factor [Candidatus Hydrogenedentota bacterium]
MLLRKNQTDADLVRRVLAGRREDFGALVERHLPSAFAVAYSRTGNRADAEDAAQEAFLRALKTLDRLREPEKFAPWLLTITRNVTADLLLARTRERSAVMNLHRADEDSWLPNMEQREMWSKLHEQIQQLDEEPREVLLLHYFAGKRTREIAGLLNLSHDAVRKRLQRARETLGARMLDELQPERSLQPILKKRGAAITAAALAAPVAWQTASASALPAVAGAAIGKWLAGAVAIAIVMAGIVVVMRENDRSDAPSAEITVASGQQAAPSSREIDPVHPAADPPQSAGVLAPSAGAGASPTRNPALDTIRGRVIDAMTGKGLNLGVTLTGELVGNQEIYERGNEDGTFAIDVSKRGYGAFTLSCRNYYYYPFASVDGERRPGVPIPEIVLKVRELATISGRVLYADGSPASNASIMRQELAGNYDTETLTGEDGRYAVHHQGGRFVLYASQGMLCSEEAVFEPAADESLTHDFVLPKSGEIHITIRTTDGAVVEDIRESLLATQAVSAPYLLAERIKDNEFVVRELPYDVYTIVFRAPGYEPAEVSGIRLDGQQPRADVHVNLQHARLYELTVRVLAPDGKPLPNAGVVLNLVTERLDAQGNVQAVLRNTIGQNGLNTDANGEWSTAGLPAGDYEAYCNDAAGKGEVAIAVPDERTATLQLAARDPVHFRVEAVDALNDNKPLSPIDVHAFVVHGDGTISEGMALGENHIVVIKEGHTAYMETVLAEPRSSDDPLVIRAEFGEGGTVEGNVWTADGLPIPMEPLFIMPEHLWTFAAGNWMDLQKDDGWKELGRSLAQRASTDASGHFSIGYLPEGRYIIALVNGATSEPFDIAPGMLTSPVEIGEK